MDIEQCDKVEHTRLPEHIDDQMDEDEIDESMLTARAATSKVSTSFGYKDALLYRRSNLLVANPRSGQSLYYNTSSKKWTNNRLFSIWVPSHRFGLIDATAPRPTSYANNLNTRNCTQEGYLTIPSLQRAYSFAFALPTFLKSTMPSTVRNVVVSTTIYYQAPTTHSVGHYTRRVYENAAVNHTNMPYTTLGPSTNPSVRPVTLDKMTFTTFTSTVSSRYVNEFYEITGWESITSTGLYDIIGVRVDVQLVAA